MSVDPSSKPTSNGVRAARGGDPASRDATAQTLVTSGDTMASPEHGRGPRIALAIAAMLAAAGGLWARNLQTGTPASGATEPLAETATAVPSASTDAHQATQETLVLTLRASPTHARFYLDDGPAIENPFIGTLPRDGKAHALRVEAEGHVTRMRELTFDKDVVVDVSLDKEKTRPSPSAVAAPRPQPQPTTVIAPPKPTQKRQLDTDNPFK
jgi:hypothetical protein